MTYRRSTAILLAICAAGAFWLVGCDSAPGVYQIDGIPPRVSDLSLSPNSVVFDELPPELVIGDSVALVDIAFEVNVRDEDNDIDSVLFVVNSPFDPFAPLSRGILSASGGESFTATERLIIKRGNEGRYTILVYAVDSNGNLSNQARGILDYSLGTGRAPVIESIEGPDSIRPPTTLVLIAVVRDPDGLGNIARVTLTAPNGGAFDMFDDGQSLGDEVANDGRYTARFDVPTAEPGVQTFRFQAFDRSGLASEIVTKDITVVGF
jgi:hypothetical protein